MNMFTVAFYTVKRNFRDLKGVSNMILMPIVIILILGNALGSTYKPRSVGKTEVAYLNLDQGVYGQDFDRWIKDGKIAEYLELKGVSSYEEGLKLVNDRKAFAFIQVREKYSEAIEKNSKSRIEVYSSKFDGFRSKIVQSIVDSYVNVANAAVEIAQLGKTPEFKEMNFVKELPVAASGNIPKAMDYYSVTMLVMTIMYGALYSVHNIKGDLFESMGARLKSLPVKISTQLAGIILGVMVTVILQALAVFGFTKLAFGANWGSDYLSIGIILVSLVALSVTLGVMVSMLIKDRMAAAGIVSGIIPAFTFISGGYAYLSDNNPVISFMISYMTPNALAHTAIFNNIYWHSNFEIWASILSMWGITLIMFAIATAAGRRRLA